ARLAVRLAKIQGKLVTQCRFCPPGTGVSEEVRVFFAGPPSSVPPVRVLTSSHQLRGNNQECCDGWKRANTAPCGSAITAMRPTPSIVIGARWKLAPFSFA